MLLIQRLSKLSFILVLLSYLCVLAIANTFDQFGEAAKMLPDHFGNFHAQLPSSKMAIDTTLQNYNAQSAATRLYEGGKFQVTLIKMRSESAAYAFLTRAATTETVKSGYVGTASVDSSAGIMFFKGATIVDVKDAAKAFGGFEFGDFEAVLGFSRSFAQTLEGNENEIPVLVKHLPDWETAQAHAAYAVSLASLKNIIEDQPVLDALNFVEGTEAVVGPYDSSQLAIVEYTTPQIAADNDARIKESMEKLRSENQPVPSAYRRVGNYSVFVFHAPDARTAENLIDRVHYEQLVQWLGDNPRALQRAQREYAATTAGMILAVLKASGLALILCLGVGGMFGSIVFLRRRAQQTANTAYTDAGGLMRLNLDDLTVQTDSARLLGKGGN